jgi:hypothetical protein
MWGENSVYGSHAVVVSCNPQSRGPSAFLIETKGTPEK